MTRSRVALGVKSRRAVDHPLSRRQRGSLPSPQSPRLDGSQGVGQEFLCVVDGDDDANKWRRSLGKQGRRQRWSGVWRAAASSDSAVLAYSRDCAAPSRVVRLGSPSSSGLFKRSRNRVGQRLGVRSAVMTTGVPWSARTCAPGTVGSSALVRRASSRGRLESTDKDRWIHGSLPSSERTSSALSLDRVLTRRQALGRQSISSGVRDLRLRPTARTITSCLRAQPCWPR